jgi:hypothetical protein
MIAPGARVVDACLRAASAGRVVAECDRKIVRYREALDSGADPVLVTGWIAEVQARRAEAEAQLGEANRASGRMSREQIRSLVETISSVRGVLARAEPADKAKVYKQLGLRLTSQPSVGRILSTGLDERFEELISALVVAGPAPRRRCLQQDLAPFVGVLLGVAFELGRFLCESSFGGHRSRLATLVQGWRTCPCGVAAPRPCAVGSALVHHAGKGMPLILRPRGRERVPHAVILVGDLSL